MYQSSLPSFSNKNEVKAYCIMACKRQYGFAPDMCKINILSYNNRRIIFTTGGKKYIIEPFKDIPLVSLIDFVMPYDY